MLKFFDSSLERFIQKMYCIARSFVVDCVETYDKIASKTTKTPEFFDNFKISLKQYF